MSTVRCTETFFTFSRFSEVLLFFLSFSSSRCLPLFFSVLFTGHALDCIRTHLHLRLSVLARRLFDLLCLRPLTSVTLAFALAYTCACTCLRLRSVASFYGSFLPPHLVLAPLFYWLSSLGNRNKTGAHLSFSSFSNPSLTQFRVWLDGAAWPAVCTEECRAS